LGVGAFLGFGPTPLKLTIASYSPGDPEKNGFCLGGIGPHLGEIWGFEFWHFFGFLANFGLLLLGTLSTDFRFFDCVRQPHVPANDAENLTKIKFDNFKQCALEVGGWGTFGALLGFAPFGSSHPPSDPCVL